MRSKYTYTRDYFYSIDSEDKAYWLGFIFADGCIENNTDRRIHRLCITISQKDTGHLEKLKECITFSGSISYFERNFKNRNTTYSCKISIPGKQIVNDLIECGCGPNKTFNLSMTKLQPRFIRHFIRGYFDGDGSISLERNKYWRVAISCTKEFGKDLGDLINKYLNIPCKLYKDKSIYSLKVHKQDHVKKFLTWLYKDATIYLDRKFKLYQTLR